LKYRKSQTILKQGAFVLVEVKDVRQIPDEGIRRWFMDKNMDLILWYDNDSDQIVGFQISYDKRSVQRTVTWKSGDEGKTSSSLTCDGPYNKKRVIRLIENNSGELESDLKDFIVHQLKKKN
jgi:hypothetical protein